MRPPAVLILLLLAPILAAQAGTGPDETFHWRRDTLAFANDTALAYGVSDSGSLTMRSRETEAAFAHRCFVMCRAVMQFHRFARFAPELAPLTADEYRARLRHLFRIPVWLDPRPESKRIVFPGFADLHSFSGHYEQLIKENIGEWFPTYLRFGNWRIAFITPRSGQERLADWLVEHVDRGELRAVYLFRIPWMNHVVVVHGYERLENGDIQFRIYDPNYPADQSTLLFRAAERSFDFPKRWYWTGGRVNVMRVYISPIH